MKNTDLYTKCVLTLIAVCLSFIVLKDLQWITPAKADVPPSPMPGTQYGLVPLNQDGSITVRLSTMEEIDVNIREISTSDKLKVEISSISTYDELPVNIDEIGGSSVSSGGPISVKMK